MNSPDVPATVDVIVPCYRYGHFLAECVRSILEQSNVGVRVLIIDDASPDNTREVAKQLVLSDSRVAYLRHSSNVGHIATYNEGISWVDSDYYLLLSADDYLLPGALSAATSVLAENSDAVFCFGRAREVYSDGSTRPTFDGMPVSQHGHQVLSSNEFIEKCRKLGTVNFVPTPTAVVRSCVQKSTVAYRPELPHSGDMELWLRLASIGPVAFVNREQAVYRRHSANMSTQYNGANRLKDLAQRVAAVEYFIRDLPRGWDRLSMRSELLRPIAADAIDGAHVALGIGRLAVCQEYRAFAISLDPTIRWSRSFITLTLKEHFGVRLTRIASGQRRS